MENRDKKTIQRNLVKGGISISAGFAVSTFCGAATKFFINNSMYGCSKFKKALAVIGGSLVGTYVGEKVTEGLLYDIDWFFNTFDKIKDLKFSIETERGESDGE